MRYKRTKKIIAAFHARAATEWVPTNFGPVQVWLDASYHPADGSHHVKCVEVRFQNMDVAVPLFALPTHTSAHAESYAFKHFPGRVHEVQLAQFLQALG